MHKRTRSIIVSCCASALGLLALGTSMQASAHHSFAAVYDMKESVTVKGTISKVRLTNPHSWFYIDVKGADGKLTQWAFEAGTPSGMIRNGYKSTLIKSGDMVTVTGFHAKDQSQNMAMLKELITADGTVYGLFGPQESSAAK
jgi:DNA/RNA endonuclease YhcR with UshA esterase domain